MAQVGDSVVQFFTKTKAEMTGDADTVGAGAKVLVKGLVGGTFGSAAKITGASLRGYWFGLPDSRSFVAPSLGLFFRRLPYYLVCQWPLPSLFFGRSWALADDDRRGRGRPANPPLATNR